MDNKDLSVVNSEDLKKKVSDVQIFGDPDLFKLVSKASSESQGWMKSTKVMNLPDGMLVQVTTQQKNPDGSYAVAEALQYVPHINMELKNGKIIMTDLYDDDDDFGIGIYDKCVDCDGSCDCANDITKEEVEEWGKEK